MALLKACRSLDQLFTLASKIADDFKSRDDVLAMFEKACVEQLYEIEAMSYREAAGYQMLTVKVEA